MHSTNFSLGTLVVADCWSQDTDSIRKDNNMHKWNSTEYLKHEEFVTCNVTTKSLIYYLQSRCQILQVSQRTTRLLYVLEGLAAV